MMNLTREMQIVLTAGLSLQGRGRPGSDLLTEEVAEGLLEQLRCSQYMFHAHLGVVHEVTGFVYDHMVGLSASDKENVLKGCGALSFSEFKAIEQGKYEDLHLKVTNTLETGSCWRQLPGTPGRSPW